MKRALTFTLLLALAAGCHGKNEMTDTDAAGRTATNDTSATTPATDTSTGLSTSGTTTGSTTAATGSSTAAPEYPGGHPLRDRNSNMSLRGVNPGRTPEPETWTPVQHSARSRRTAPLRPRL